MKTRTTKIAVVLIAFAMFLSIVAVLKPIARVKADTEPNDSFAQAESITPGTYTGTVDDTTDVDDYYTITVLAGQTLDVNATPASGLQVWLGLYDVGQSEVISDLPNMGVMAKVSLTTNSAQSSYTYYILVEAWSGSGAYTLKVSLTSQNDANSGGDAGDVFDTATQLASTNATYAGFFKDLDVDDVYMLTVSAGQTVSVNATPPSTLQVWLGLFDPARNQVISDLPNKGVMAKVSWTTNSAQVNYTYYVWVEAWSGSGTYSFVVNLASQNDANSGGDAGDTFDAATQLASVNSTYSGFLKDADTDDYYKVNVLAGQTLAVNVTPASGLQVALQFYNPARNTVFSDYPNQGVMAKASWTTNSAMPNYTYYVRVDESSGFGTYSMVVSLVSQNDAGTGGDAGDDLSTARPVSIATYSGFMRDDDTSDCYRITQNVTTSQGLFVKVTPSASQAVAVTLYDQAMSQKDYKSGNPGVAVTANARATATGIFYIKVSSFSGYGAYTFKITVEPVIGVPSQTPAVPSPGQSVTVSVNVTAVQDGVGAVTLSYSTSGASWTDVAMTLNGTTGLYQGTIPGMPGNTTVYYKVTAYDTAGDYFVQDKTGVYYTYSVVPEFSALIILLLLCIVTPVAALLGRRRNKIAIK